MPSQSPEALDELAAFVAVVEAQGFRAASRSTHARKATLSKRVQDLEARLGVPLLVRTTRSIRLTDEGRAYYEGAARAIAAVRDAEAAVLDAKREPRGVLRVSTSASIGALLMDGVVASYLSKYPDVRVELHATERRVDIYRERFDLAVWAGALEDSSLIARRLGVAAGGYYASPRYLSSHQPLEAPTDLAEHNTIVVPKGDAPNDWTFIIGGRLKKVSVKPRLVVTELELAARAAVLNLGVVRAPQQTVQPYLASRALVPVLVAATPPGLDVHAIFPSGGTLVPKTRVFVEMLAAWFEGTKLGGKRSAGP